MTKGISSFTIRLVLQSALFLCVAQVGMQALSLMIDSPGNVASTDATSAVKLTKAQSQQFYTTITDVRQAKRANDPDQTSET